MTLSLPPAADAEPVLFAGAAPGTLPESAWERLAGKATRFLARNIRNNRLAMRNARPMVSFSFDDVLASATTVGAAILERQGVRGTFYVSGGGCGAASACGRIADADEIRSVSRRGHEIGCHTFSHPALSRLGSAAIAAEIARNRAFFERIDPGLVIDNFAFPYGDISLSSKFALQRRFLSCRSIQPGINAGAIDLGAMKAVALQNSSMTADDVADTIAATVAGNGWLIFFSHDVDPGPSEYGVTPALLDTAVTLAIAAGCVPVTVADGLALASAEAQRPQ